MKRLTALLVLVASLAFASPAGAMVNGQPDGNRHPYVGMTFNDEFLCSGTLISPTVFLTAGHCADFLRVPEQGQGFVTFQEKAAEFPEDVPVAAAFVHPGFCIAGGFTVDACSGRGVLGFAQNDVGVAILARPVRMDRYGRLPSLRLVDRLAQRADLTAVGYGQRAGNNKPSPFAERFRARVELKQEAPFWRTDFYRTTANPAQGKGGICFGDSGGPDFVAGTRIITGVHSLVNNGQCAGITWSARVDTRETLRWIRSFL